MDIAVNILSFVVALGVIIFVHEGGHFLVAKLFDVRVLTFSLGFGKRVFGFSRGETEYRVSWVPLGGYVRLGGEHPEEASGDPMDFQSKPRWQRVLVYLAGPLANVALAVALIAVIFMIGFGIPHLQDIPPVVGTVVEGSAGEAAGIRPGDEIVAIKGREVANWQDVQMAIMESPEQEVAVAVDRGGRGVELTVTPEKTSKYEFGDAGIYPRVLPKVSAVIPDSPAESAGFLAGDEVRKVDGVPLASPLELITYVSERAGVEIAVEVLREAGPTVLTVVPAEHEGGVGRIGVDLARRYGPLEAVYESLRYNWNVATQTVLLVGKLFKREVKPQSALHGPIEIAALSGEAARQGLPSLIHLMGLVSISIAILNLLPIPILDGGQITILIIESTMRRDLSIRLKEAVNLVGLAIIMVLMVAVLLFDLGRNLPFDRGGAEPSPAEPSP